jgi:hypothetical protein
MLWCWWPRRKRLERRGYGGLAADVKMGILQTN